MAEFQELIKNFDKIRDYMRQFYIYGFKVRSEYKEKSSRTYDNERRRIESYLADYMQSSYSSKGKQVFLNIDSKSVPQNPLYAAWKSKSFTDNDILLHYFILDILWDEETSQMKASDLADQISLDYGVAFDSQTVRLKLREYENLGILKSHTDKKSVYYSLQRDCISPSVLEHLLDALKFFQEAAPLGVIGSTILDDFQVENDLFRFQNHYIVHTLEDGVLITILKAIREHQKLCFENFSSRSQQVQLISGLPLKIFVSTQTGRRYVCVYLEKRRRFQNTRLDAIRHVTPEGYVSDEMFLKMQGLLNRNIPLCWGVSFGNHAARKEEIYLKLWIDEEKEAFVLNRLYREGRGGEVIRVEKNVYLYSGAFFDTNEILPWVKTFTGRILDIQGSNAFVIAKLCHDLDKMYEMYAEDT